MPREASPLKPSRHYKKVPVTAIISARRPASTTEPRDASSSTKASHPELSTSRTLFSISGSPSKGKVWWQPRDIFDPNAPSWLGDQESKTGPSAAPFTAAANELEVEESEDDLGLGDLDVTAIAAQLSNVPPTQVSDDYDVDESKEEVYSRRKSHLRAHYLQYLLAAKAPVNGLTPLSCTTCNTDFDPRSSLEAHRMQPFHVVEAWISREVALAGGPEDWQDCLPQQFGFFERRSLQEAGLEVGLGHFGHLCPQTSSNDNFDMTILHVTGQHTVTFRPCACSGAEKWQQLLESRVFPATEFAPKTGFTFELLDHHQAFSLRAKVTLREYYQAVVDLTAAGDRRRPPMVYEQLRAAVRQYRVLVMHLRAGRTDATGPMAPGELCVTCPACPQPGVNLPSSWESDPLCQLRYSRFLSGDGNFKLQRLAKRKSSKNDPTFYQSLLRNGAFWAPKDEFHSYINNTTPAADEPGGRQRNSCNTMAGDPGLAPQGGQAVEIPGIFLVSCRHIVICKNGAVDFYHGERFRPVDVAFSGPLNDSYTSGIRYFVITYDIACKYGVNFRKRCFNDDPWAALVPTPDGEMFIMFCVNKFHQESHEESCSAKNALNYTKYVGRTCGEGVETIWASLNWLRYSTREMTAGGREETLSEHFNWWNWLKVIGLVDYLKKAYFNAIQSYRNVRVRFENIKSSLGDESVKMLELEYEEKGGEQFLERDQELRWPSRKELTAQMAEIARPLPSSTQHSGKSVSYIDVVSKALSLEELQTKLIQRAQELSQLSAPTAQLTNQVAKLRQNLEAGLSRHYSLLLDVAPQFRESGRCLVPDIESPQTDEILLPSRLSPTQVQDLGIKDLLDVEVQLRVGHACDCIQALKKALSLRSFWTRHTRAQHSSQTKKTKNQASLRNSQLRVKEASRAYSTCYAWLVQIAPDVASRFGLRPLVRDDLALLSEYLEGEKYKNRNGELPWIWRIQPNTDTVSMEIEEVAEASSRSNPSALEALVDTWSNESHQLACAVIRLEYVHAHAAFDRWGEEVTILGSEMPATVRWFANRAVVWRNRAEGTEESLPGYRAYASRQVMLYLRLAEYARSTFTQAVGGKDRWNAIMEVGELLDQADEEDGTEDIDEDI
ncbi:hypothetical protein FRB90_005207 [Tulasnella sp. 427]|nr:hypothetical protein FRB90_005207 [Tulasnella sp. 427]